MQKGGRGMEGGGSIEEGWMAGGTRKEEVRQGRKEEVRQSGRRRKGWRKDAKQGGGREGRPPERS